ncbi:uncharacterized protein LOC131834293 isoform X6 [Mustela lutreola]|uniref:uncharacterized protein LOC131834293 isoform X6 n=1 Tax=Mustela lutreola TaxID=9666 RepID=UPI00279795F3|nr:uncharacterized protein LOC131834293 isoform X6 [Mustela lutreola]
MTKLSKMMLTALLIMVLFFLNQVTLEKVTRENEREKAHERTQAGRATEREGETGSLLSRDPNAGLHPRIPGSQSELKANTQPTESSMCFKENTTKYHIIIAIFGIIILILLGLFIYKYYCKKNDNKNEDHLEENGFQQEIGFYLLDDCHNLIINLLGGKLNTRLPGGRHNYILIGGKKSSRL